MNITDAKYDRYIGLILQVEPAQALNWLTRFKAGEYDITPHTKKRSNRANAYAWELINQIAARINLPADEVYRNAIKDIAGHSETMIIPHGSYSKFKRLYCGDHIGRDVLIIDEDELGDTVQVTFGSSDYDTAQMSALIDSLQTEAEALGIETMNSLKLKGLLI